MTSCDDDVYTVACVIPVQRKVRAKDADEARAVALAQGWVTAQEGVGVGWPLEITVTKEAPMKAVIGQHAL